jgi:hypothetical protein
VADVDTDCQNASRSASRTATASVSSQAAPNTFSEVVINYYVAPTLLTHVAPTNDAPTSDCQPNAPHLGWGGVAPFYVGVHLILDASSRSLCYLGSEEESSDDDSEGSVFFDLSID